MCFGAGSAGHRPSQRRMISLCALGRRTTPHPPAARRFDSLFRARARIDGSWYSFASRGAKRRAQPPASCTYMLRCTQTLQESLPPLSSKREEDGSGCAPGAFLRGPSLIFRWMLRSHAAQLNEACSADRSAFCCSAALESGPRRTDSPPQAPALKKLEPTWQVFFSFFF